MLEVGVVQEFKPGRSRQLSRKQMQQLAAAMDATALDRERIVRREVRKLWTQLAYVGAARTLLADQASWVEQLRQSARARYASGEGRQLDVLQAGLDAAMLREQQLDLDRDDAMYRSQLSFWLGAEDAARAQPAGLRRAPNSNRWRARGAARRTSGATGLHATHRCRPHGGRRGARTAQTCVDARRQLRLPPGRARRHVPPGHAERDGHRRPAALPRRPPGSRRQRRQAGRAGPRRTARRSPARNAGDAGGSVEHRRTARPNSSASTRRTCCRWPNSRSPLRCSAGAPTARCSTRSSWPAGSRSKPG